MLTSEQVWQNQEKWKVHHRNCSTSLLRSCSRLLIIGGPEDSGYERRKPGLEDLLASCYADLRTTNRTL